MRHKRIEIAADEFAVSELQSIRPAPFGNQLHNAQTVEQRFSLGLKLPQGKVTYKICRRRRRLEHRLHLRPSGRNVGTVLNPMVRILNAHLGTGALAVQPERDPIACVRTVLTQAFAPVGARFTARLSAHSHRHSAILAPAGKHPAHL